MVHELHEGRPEQLTDATVRQHQIIHSHEGHEKNEANDDANFRQEVALPPARQTVVPDGGEQLLTVRVSHELKKEEHWADFSQFFRSF